MIRYALRCADAHRFDAWFGSSADYDRLRAAGLVTCAVCGGDGVEKDLMAPAVAAGGTVAPPEKMPESGPEPSIGRERPLSVPASPVERALAALRRRVEATAENVGRDFAREARRIHEGAAPERPIWGEARPSEARALIEDGIPVAPLPFPARKVN